MASEPEHRRTLLVKNLNPYISEARVQVRGTRAAPPPQVSH